MKSHKGLKQALEDLAKDVDLGFKGDDDLFTQWCWIAAGASDGGGPAGAACCRDGSAGLRRIQVAIINWNANRGWSAEEDGRWLFLTSTLRKIVMGLAAGNSWTSVLRTIKTHWGLSDDVEAALVREIEASESDNFHTKSKLKLLRFVKTVCSQD